MQVIRIDRLVFHYTNEKLVFNEFSITFNQGTIYRITGANGTGKSTLIKILCGLITPIKGQITYFETNLNITYKIKKSIGYYISFLPNSIDEFTVLQYFEYLRSMYDFDSSRIDFCSRYFEITYLSQRIDSLSSGMRQKVELIGSILHNPKICFWDEPFTNLDDLSKQKFKEFINLNMSECTFIIVSHENEWFLDIAHEAIPIYS